MEGFFDSLAAENSPRIGWPQDMGTSDTCSRVVNEERRGEERRGEERKQAP
jgi:hypothetical protein